MQYVHVVDPDRGVMEVAEVGHDDQGFKITVGRLLVREEGGMLLFNWFPPSDNESDVNNSLCQFGRLIRKDDSVIIYPCRKEAVLDLIKKRVILGTVTQDKESNDQSVTVTGSFDVLAKRLASPEGLGMIDVEEPVFLTKESSSP